MLEHLSMPIDYAFNILTHLLKDFHNSQASCNNGTVLALKKISLSVYCEHLNRVYWKWIFVTSRESAVYYIHKGILLVQCQGHRFGVFIFVDRERRHYLFTRINMGILRNKISFSARFVYFRRWMMHCKLPFSSFFTITLSLTYWL